MIKMHVFRNFSICVALVSMAAFTITGCCSGNCGLLGGGAGSAVPSHSGGSCSTCGTGGSYSSPTQSFASPTYAAPTESYSTQGFSTQQFSNSVPTSAGSGSVNLPSVQGGGGQSFGGGSGSISVPSVGGSGGR